MMIFGFLGGGNILGGWHECAQINKWTSASLIRRARIPWVKCWGVPPGPQRQPWEWERRTDIQEWAGQDLEGITSVSRRGGGIVEPWGGEYIGGGSYFRRTGVPASRLETNYRPQAIGEMTWHLPRVQTVAKKFTAPIKFENVIAW